MVAGGGIVGVQAALDLANAGYYVQWKGLFSLGY
jgi:heterodisulfide reductase subunit A-like polyferredoxin